jgi:hypothetical protein
MGRRVTAKRTGSTAPRIFACSIIPENRAAAAGTARVERAGCVQRPNRYIHSLITLEWILSSIPPLPPATDDTQVALAGHEIIRGFGG